MDCLQQYQLKKTWNKQGEPAQTFKPDIHLIGLHYCFIKLNRHLKYYHITKRLI